MTLYIILGILFVFLGFAVSVYNSLVAARNTVQIGRAHV